jgi:hypothetical protein
MVHLVFVGLWGNGIDSGVYAATSLTHCQLAKWLSTEYFLIPKQSMSIALTFISVTTVAQLLVHGT